MYFKKEPYCALLFDNFYISRAAVNPSCKSNSAKNAVTQAKAH